MSNCPLGSDTCVSPTTFLSDNSNCGSCGNACGPLETCVDGVCEGPACRPNCAGRECGPDSCGGSCGTCSSSSTCNSNGQCVCNQVMCPDVVGMTSCGPVGPSCSGTCCPSGTACMTNSTDAWCEASPPCDVWCAPGYGYCMPNNGDTCQTVCCDTTAQVCIADDTTAQCLPKVTCDPCAAAGSGSACAPGDDYCSSGAVCCAAGTTCQVNSTQGACCGDSICTIGVEDDRTCPADCAVGGYCGDGACVSPEICDTCYIDCNSQGCFPPISCDNDGICESTVSPMETCSCADCASMPACKSSCGDKMCEIAKGENCVTCQSDCGTCSCGMPIDCEAMGKVSCAGTSPACPVCCEPTQTCDSTQPVGRCVDSLCGPLQCIDLLGETRCVPLNGDTCNGVCCSKGFTCSQGTTMVSCIPPAHTCGDGVCSELDGETCGNCLADCCSDPCTLGYSGPVMLGCVFDNTCYPPGEDHPNNPCVACDATGAWLPKSRGVACTSDSNECTLDACDGIGYCAHEPLPADTVCTGGICDDTGHCGRLCMNNEFPCLPLDNNVSARVCCPADRNIHCQRGEHDARCGASVCGDGYCGADENCTTCSSDCGSCGMLVCGNGRIEPGEQCEGADFNGLTCLNFDDFIGGYLTCDPARCLINTTFCSQYTVGLGSCGDGRIDPGEQCDDPDWGDITSCRDFGFTSGILTCDTKDTCLFNTSSCSLAPTNATIIFHPVANAQLCGDVQVRALVPYGIDFVRFYDNNAKFADVRLTGLPPAQQGFAAAYLPQAFAQGHGGTDDNLHRIKAEARRDILFGSWVVSADEVSVTYDCTAPTVRIDNTTLAAGQVLSGTHVFRTLPVSFDAVSASASYASMRNLSSLKPIGMGTALAGRVWQFSWDTRAIADGSYTVVADAIDDMGWRGSDSAQDIIIDNTPPVFTAFAPAAGTILNGSAELSFIANDSLSGINLSSARFTFDRQTWIPLPCGYLSFPARVACADTWSTSGSPDGIYTITYRIEDNAGNMAESDALVYEVQNYPQNVILLRPASGAMLTGANAPTLASAPEGTAKVWFDYSADGTVWSMPAAEDATLADGWGLAIPLPADGTYHFRARAFDSQGKLLGKDQNYPVTVDNTAPFVTITQPKAGANISGVQRIEAQTWRNISGMPYTAYDVTHVRWEYSDDLVHYLTFADIQASQQAQTVFATNWNTLGLQGTYRLRAIAYDRVNLTATDEISLTIDNAPPLVRIITPRGGTVSGIVTVQFEANDTALDPSQARLAIGSLSDMPVSCQLAGAAMLCAASWDTTLLQDGAYPIEASIRDENGNRGSDHVTVAVDNTPEPVMLIAPPDGTISTGSIDAEALAPTYTGRMVFTATGERTSETFTDSSAGDGWKASISTTAYPEGEYTLLAEAYSTFFIFNTQYLGNDSIRFIVDKTAPNASMFIYSSAFPLQDTNPECTGRRDVLLHIAYQDNYGVKDCRFGNTLQERDTAAWESCGADKPWLLPAADGNHTVFAQVRDFGNNIASIQDSITYSHNGSCLDASPPSAPIVIDDGDFTANDTMLHAYWYGAYDLQSDLLRIPLVYSYRVQDNSTGAYLNLTGTPGQGVLTTMKDVRLTNLSLDDAHKYVFEVQSVNYAGLRSPTASSDGIIVDTTLPAVVVSSPTHPDQGTWYNQSSVNLSWTGIDAVSGVGAYSYVMDEMNLTDPDLIPEGDPSNLSGKTQTSFVLPDGIWHFHIKARDLVGNWGPAVHFTVRIDKALGAPNITILRPLGVTRSNTPELVIETNKQAICTLRQVSPERGVYNRTLAFSQTGSTQHSATLVLMDQDYVFNYTCTDFRGAASSVEHAFRVAPDARPTALYIRTNMSASGPYYAGGPMNVLVEAVTEYNSVANGLDGLDGLIFALVDHDQVSSFATGIGNGFYILDLRAPVNATTHTLNATSLGVTSDEQDFEVTSDTLTIEFNGTGARSSLSNIAYVSTQGYTLGVAGDNTELGADALRAITDASGSRSYVFITMPYADLPRKNEQLSLEEFLSQLRPSFGLPKKDAQTIMTEVQAADIVINGKKQVGPGRYTLVIRNVGKTADGRTYVQVDIT